MRKHWWPPTHFWLRVYPRGDCWEFRGPRVNGYGYHQGWRAQRLSYYLVKGEIPPGYVIDHLCRHPYCVRPSHLQAVTRRVNVLRGQSLPARQAAQTHCKRGHIFDAANTYISKRGERICRVCAAARQRARRQQNPEAVRAYDRARWPRRARRAHKPLTPENEPWIRGWATRRRNAQRTVRCAGMRF